MGYVWRHRWYYLRLFTPAGSSSLPGLPFPAGRREHPDKDAAADYLAVYAEHFGLPVEPRTQVEAVHRDGTDLAVVTSRGTWRAGNVVVATGAHHTPAVPGVAGQLDASIVQLHAGDYRRPAQRPPGPVIVVGAGNFGARQTAWCP